MREFVKDLLPRDVPFLSLYENKVWDSFTGDTHTWDRIHVAMPNDAGDWEQMDATACAMAICDPESRQIDWGATRASFHKFRRAWKTRILCLDQLRHVEEAEQQLEAIWQGLAKVPEYIQADWLKYQQALGSDFIYPCSSSVAPVTTTAAMFTGGLNLFNIGAGNLPTSKLVMPFLMQQIPRLQYNGYFDGEFVPAGMFKLITDIQTAYDLCNGNPALTQMFQAADFEKGGKYFKYGAMMGCGNFLIQIHPYPPRFNPTTTAGVLRRVWPFQNMPTTVGMRPTVDPQYENACYQISVIPHRKAREIYTGEIPSIHPEFKFGSRDLWGKWKWINDAYLVAFDPNDGTSCEMENPRRNKGYFLADFEAGVRNTRPELECVILHQREKQAMVDLPRCADCTEWNETATYQSLLPYNSFCISDEEEAEGETGAEAVDV